MEIFNNNKYTKMYLNIVEKAKCREFIEGYFERHHIIPKSLGGCNDDSNIVKLTAREHFVCHWLLTKMCKIDEHARKMKYAMRSMSWDKTNNRKLFSWQYDLVKKKISESSKDRVVKATTREKISLAGKNRFSKPEEREKMKSSKIKSELSKHTTETKEKISSKMKKFYEDENNLNSMKERIKIVQSTEEFRKRRSDAAKERYKSREDLKILVSEQFKGIPKKKILCPHCSKEVAINTSKRWHFDNCKSKC